MSKTWLRVLAIFEIVGGISGLIFVIGLLFRVTINIYEIVTGVLLVSIFCLSLVAGIALWRGHRYGRILSIIIQFLQLPKIMSPLLIFYFSFGFDIYPWLVFTSNVSNAGLNAHFFIEYRLLMNIPNAPIGIGVSIVSCIFLFLLLRPWNPEIEQVIEPNFDWNEEAGEQGREDDTGKSSL